MQILKKETVELLKPYKSTMDDASKGYLYAITSTEIDAFVTAYTEAYGPWNGNRSCRKCLLSLVQAVVDPFNCSKEYYDSQASSRKRTKRSSTTE